MTRRLTAQKNYLAPGDVAEMLMVSPATVRHWASKGELHSVSTPGGHRRFLPHDIEKFARERNLTIQIHSRVTQRILIVDDDIQVAKLLSRMLERAAGKRETMLAHDGYNAGRLVQSFRPHVVLLDLMMPELNGFEVCQQIKRDPTTKATRIIAMTGFFNDTNVQRAMDAGAECCIEKPFDREKLMQLLRLDSFDQAAATGQYS